jgi:hypothetical protein
MILLSTFDSRLRDEDPGVHGNVPNTIDVYIYISVCVPANFDLAHHVYMHELAWVNRINLCHYILSFA